MPLLDKSKHCSFFSQLGSKVHGVQLLHVLLCLPVHFFLCSFIGELSIYVEYQCQCKNSQITTDTLLASLAIVNVLHTRNVMPLVHNNQVTPLTFIQWTVSVFARMSDLDNFGSGLHV